MTRNLRHTTAALATILLCVGTLDAGAQTVAGPEPTDAPPAEVAPMADEAPRLLYTTYFYTAAEAVIHGYEADTEVRIVRMDGGGPVWTGTVGVGETELVRTGRGVFGFLSNKKAAILVGTPSSCTVVGYWLRDQDGRARSDHFFTRLPSSTGFEDDRMLVWAWEPGDIVITDITTDTEVARASLNAGSYFEMDHAQLSGLSDHVLEVRASAPSIEVQVYYDEGFAVPGRDGRASGTEFFTYVGSTTEGVNDLVLVSYHAAANVRVQDIRNDEVLFEGEVGREQAHTLTLSQKYVKVTSDVEISVYVAPYAHYGSGYAEHHFSMGAEGTGIEHNFLIPTPDELWLFSYFDGSVVTVRNTATDEEIWSGVLNAGNVQGLYPGHGLYQVTANRGISVQGGSQACGAEYSPAAGLFQVDEELLAAVIEVQEYRIQQAAADGRELSEEELAAPLSNEEIGQALRRVRASTGNDSYGEAEIRDRLENMAVE